MQVLERLQVALPPGRMEFHPVEPVSDADFQDLCRENPDLQFERTPTGSIVIMPPTGGATGARNSEITYQLQRWARKDGSGMAFDSSTGFQLPDDAIRAPDAAWVERSRLDALSDDEKEEYLPLCPDFLIEMRSRSDVLSKLHDKMDEYIADGLRLGWLIDPARKQVHVYRARLPMETLEDPDTVSADPVLPGFTLDLDGVWSPEM
jgi:Uma2 family endonuclease